MDNQDWMVSLEFRDKRVRLGRKARGVIRAEMEVDSQDRQARRDLQDKSSTRRQTMLAGLSAVLVLREGPVCLARLDSLVQWVQRGTEEIQDLRVIV